jgi:hypothetical protein
VRHLLLQHRQLLMHLLPLHALFMLGISLYCFNEIWDEICAALELNLNLRECFIDCDVESDEAVVLSNAKDNEKYEYADDDEFHSYLNLLSLVLIPQIRPIGGYLILLWWKFIKERLGVGPRCPW